MPDEQAEEAVFKKRLSEARRKYLADIVQAMELYTSDPDRPAAALVCLDEERKRYEAGDQNALFDAISWCACFQLVMPDWIMKALHEADGKRQRVELTSWDEVFGRPLPKSHARGQKLINLQKKSSFSISAYRTVENLKSSGQRIDARLFAQVARIVSDQHHQKTGERVDVSGGWVKDHYYRVRNRFAALPKELVELAINPPPFCFWDNDG